MCGIVGSFVFGNKDFDITDSYIINMRDALLHRGPDSCGIWISPDKRIALGHRRLSIIDLSPQANQPMCNEDGSIYVVFNGEIYNHMEIRTELERSRSHRWRTDHSDTEVILHSYEEWGIDCIERFRGMFAIAIWDARKSCLWLIRDRIGIKPLYYCIYDGRIIFASEIKAILKDKSIPRRVNEEALYNYLTFLTSPGPSTLFDGIYKLPPATWMRIDSRGNITSRRYWDVWDNVRQLDWASEDDIKKMLLEELRRSVALRKISDVPVGVFLSGGVDSSTNAALFSEESYSPVKTFSIGYDAEYGSYRNEFYYARLMADKIGSEHHEVKISVDDLIGFLPRLIYHQDEPLADPVCIPVYFVSKLARDNGVIVVQVGEGSDEIFCGYPFWHKINRLYRLCSLPFIRNALRYLCSPIAKITREDTYYYEIIRRLSYDIPVFWSGAEAISETCKRKILSDRLKREFRSYSSYEVIRPIYKRFNERAANKDLLNWMSYVDLNLRLPELLLMRIDKMSMAVSLEARVPFLDHKFVELAMSIPPKWKFFETEPKYILKRAVEGIVPKELLYRSKQGFGVPIYEWMFDRLGSYVRERIGKFVDRTDYFDRKRIREFLLSHRDFRVWTIFNFVLWHERWIDQGDI